MVPVVMEQVVRLAGYRYIKDIMRTKKIEITLREDELEELILALTFAYNNGKTPEEFGSHCMLQKLKAKLSEIKD